MQNASKFSKRVSLCILPVDTFTGEIYRKNIKILINDTFIKSIKKPSGIYVFTNIDADFVKISIESSQFKAYDEIIDLNKLNPLNPILEVRLRANENYMFPATASGVKFLLKSKKGEVLANKEIRSYINNTSGFIGLLNEDINKSAKEVSIYSVYDKNVEYSSFRIISEKEDERDEYIILGKQLNNCRYEILNDLKSSHSCKDKLLNAYITSSDERGKVLIVFNKLYKATSKLNVEVLANKALKEVSLEIAENSILDVGNVILT